MKNVIIQALTTAVLSIEGCQEEHFKLKEKRQVNERKLILMDFHVPLTGQPKLQSLLEVILAFVTAFVLIHLKIRNSD